MKNVCHLNCDYRYWYRYWYHMVPYCTVWYGTRQVTAELNSGELGKPFSVWDGATCCCASVPEHMANCQLPTGHKLKCSNQKLDRINGQYRARASSSGESTIAISLGSDVCFVASDYGTSASTVWYRTCTVRYGTTSVTHRCIVFVLCVGSELPA